MGTSKLNLWVKFPKSILIAVTLGDLGNSEPMMMCEDHFLKLPSREFTFKVYLPFRFDWVLSCLVTRGRWRWRRWASDFTAFSSASVCSFFDSHIVYKEVTLRQRCSSSEALLGHTCDFCRASGFLHLQGRSSPWAQLLLCTLWVT